MRLATINRFAPRIEKTDQCESQDMHMQRES